MFNPSAKRQRQDENEEPHDPTVQQKKKSRPLPIRTSPVLKHIKPILRNRPGPSLPVSSTLTPTESSDDDTMHDASQHLSQTHQIDPRSHAFSSMRTPYAEPDSDCEMMDSQPKSATLLQPLWSAGSGPLRPETSLESPIPSMLLNQSLNVSGGRTATPIFSHFTSHMNTDSMMRDAASPAEPQFSQASRPVQTDTEANWWRRRRLPSPISEDETQLNRVGLEDRLKQYPNDAQHYTGVYTPAGIRISVTPVQNDTPPSGFAHGPPVGHAFPSSSSSLSSYTPNGHHQPQAGLPFGHNPAHNGNLNLNTNTPATRPASNVVARSTNNQRPQKLTIAMGFRADCEKCQQRVPGHYSHIIRS